MAEDIEIQPEPFAQWHYYLDTSTFGALVDDEEPGRVKTTQMLFDRIKSGVITASTSIVTLEEVAEAPETVQTRLQPSLDNVRILDESEASIHVANELIKRSVLAENFRDDARHLGVAIAHDFNAVISWNFRHMVNPLRRRQIQSACLLLGYRAIDIISPLEVVENEI